MFEYYGGKGNLVRWGYYPAPRFQTIIEPFAGAARYALYHHENRRVILVEKNPIIVGIWKWLQSVDEKNFLSLPILKPGEAIPNIFPQAARDFLGLVFNQGSHTPKNFAGNYIERIRQLGWKRYLYNLRKIQSWEIICGDYSSAPDITATWFIDPPYSGQKLYPFGRDIDYIELSKWSQRRKGQVIVCENQDAPWLPFEALCRLRATQRKSSRLQAEGVWIKP